MSRVSSRIFALVTVTLSLVAVACGGDSSGSVGGNSADITEKKGANKATSCFGTEPFWGLEITEKTLKWDHGDVVRTIENKGPKAAIGVTPEFVSLYQGKTLEDPNRFLNVIITEGDCSDGMSDETHPYSVSVLSGTELHVGCCH